MNNASDPNQANTPLTALLLQLLPADHSAVGNGALFNQFSAACQAAGLGPVTQEDFQAAREALLATGQAVKGRGRGGATARATGADRPAFALQAPAVPATSTPAPAAKRPAPVVLEKVHRRAQGQALERRLELPGLETLGMI